MPKVKLSGFGYQAFPCSKLCSFFFGGEGYRKHQSPSVQVQASGESTEGEGERGLLVPLPTLCVGVCKPESLDKPFHTVKKEAEVR